MAALSWKDLNFRASVLWNGFYGSTSFVDAIVMPKSNYEILSPRFSVESGLGFRVQGFSSEGIGGLGPPQIQGSPFFGGSRG